MLRHALALVLCLQALVAQRPPLVVERGMVVSQERLASEVGAEVLKEGGNAVDAAVATAFALAVTHPPAGNLGGGGFLLVRLANGKAEAYDFRERAPQAARPDMFLEKGVYSKVRHHESMLAVGVPGTVAGLHKAWKDHGRLPWKRLLEPARRLAREGFPLSAVLAESLETFLPHFKPHAPTLRQFSQGGSPLKAGALLRQPDLARTLDRLALQGPKDFYRGETARLLVKEVQSGGGRMTLADLAAYQVRKRTVLRGNYRGYEILAFPPPSSGGQVLLTNLNILEGFDLRDLGPDATQVYHLAAEAMRRSYWDRAQFLGDPDANPGLPLAKLISKTHAEVLRETISEARASVSHPASGVLPPEHEETTHLSVVDEARNAVSLTYTLEDNYGVKRVVAGLASC